MSDIDPVEFGRMAAQVQVLEARVSELGTDVKQLLELANRSKGGFWMGMTIASTAGAFVSWVASHSSLFK